MALESIRQLIQGDLGATDHFIIEQLGSSIPLIKQMTEYVLSCGGKRIRPMIVLLSARALAHRDTKHINIAAIVELVHTATLLHDDVVDKSTLRRNHKTAHTLWGSDASILIGDFLYSRAFQIVVDLQHSSILEIFAKATHHIAEGEIMQLVNCKNPDTTEAFYFDIIERKTGKLFEIASQLGAIVATENRAEVIAMRDFGKHLGLAYQLIDDAIDYSQTKEGAGKNVGQDLADGKTTLPLIHAMRQSKGADLALIRDAITEGSNKHLEDILGIIESTDAIKYTANTAKHHAEQAKEALAMIPASPYSKALETLTDFVVDRTY